MPENVFRRMYRAYGGIGRGSAFFSYRWAIFNHELVSRAVPEEGKIYDLGCGYGIFDLFLALQRPSRRIVAVDFSRRRTASGIRAARRLALDNIDFIEADVFTVDLEAARAVILNDFLHHLPSWEEQRKLLARACAALSPGGKLVIVDIARRPLWKFCIGWLVDHTIYMGDRINYLEHDRFVKFLEENGIEGVNVAAIGAGRPYSNVLYTGTKR